MKNTSRRNKMNKKGNVFVFGDNVNTDEIIPARYLNTSDPEELARYCMEDVRPGFGVAAATPGGIMVAGENFGCGSSREHAPISIKGAGISCVIAQSFARIFFRNAINVGLPIVELSDTSTFKEGDQLEVDLNAGKVFNRTQNTEFSFQPYPDFLKGIIHAGGWLNYAKGSGKKEITEYTKQIAQFPYKIENITF
jgi:3-isopropylmalate/(R)-2-methylmalate dehydratase small subunit